MNNKTKKVSSNSNSSQNPYNQEKDLMRFGHSITLSKFFIKLISNTLYYMLELKVKVQITIFVMIAIFLKWMSTYGKD